MHEKFLSIPNRKTCFSAYSNKRYIALRRCVSQTSAEFFMKKTIINTPALFSINNTSKITKNSLDHRFHFNCAHKFRFLNKVISLFVFIISILCEFMAYFNYFFNFASEMYLKYITQYTQEGSCTERPKVKVQQHQKNFF